MNVRLNNCKTPGRRLRRARLPLAGFTLTEVIIALGVGGIVFVSMYAGLAQGFNSVQRAHHRLRATQVLTEKLEVIRLYSWNQVTNGYIPTTFTEYQHPADNNNPGIAYSGRIAITDAAVSSAYNTTMRKAVVQVAWVSGGITNQTSMEALISQYGIQKYIY